MALFGSKQKTSAPKSSSEPRAAHEVFGVIVRPHLTEKAAIVSERGVYVFEIADHATKRTVAEAVTALYRVIPVRVNIVRRSSRTSMGRMRRFKNHERGSKKAYVYLKAGDRIEFA